MGTPSAASTAGATTPRPALPLRRVRVIGNVRACPASGGGDASSSDPSGVPRVSVLKLEAGTSSHATVVFGAGPGDAFSRRESYRLDWCYDRDEDVGVLFQKEVKPLMEATLQGDDATVIAFGAKGSGKTQLIEGSDEKPGLASLAIAHFLALREEFGCSVQVSYYEVHHDRVLDLIEKKDQGVQVLEDATGRVQLKGLSQVPIGSVSDFSKLFVHEVRQQKPSKKNTTDDNAIARSHKGLIIYVSHHSSNDPALLCKGRMNFVDLAGYEDTKQMSSNRPLLVETARINKTLYALTNLLGALNRNEARVAYRESKLTHLLKGSLSKENSHTLMITCMDQKCCQETIQALSMASQSCLVSNPIRMESVAKNHNKQRPSLACSPVVSRSLSSSASFKKMGVSRLGLLDKKPNGPASVVKGRKLFNNGSPVTKSIQEQTSFHAASGEKAQELSEAVDKIRPFSDATIIIPLSQELESSTVLSPATSFLHQEEVRCGKYTQNESEVEESMNANCLELEYQESHCVTSDKKEVTPPLSVRLREITNSLKALSYQPLDQIAPKTPGVLFNIMSEDDDSKVSGSAQQILNSRSTRLKKSLVHELLNYINSASEDELLQLKGIGKRRAAYIVEVREQSPFKDMNDLKRTGLSSKQVKEMMKNVLGEYYE